MSIALAVLASICIGSGEAFASQFVQRYRSEVVTVAFFVAGIIVSIPLVVVVPSEFRTADFLNGLYAGVAGGVALLLLYRAYRLVPVGVGAPLIGVQSALWPVLYAITFGDEHLAPLSVIGIVFGAVALLLVSFDPSPVDGVKLGVAMALLSGFLFAVMVILFATTSEESGLWSLVGQRISGAVIAVIGARSVSNEVFPESGSRLKLMAVGSLGTFGAAAYILAAQKGSLSEVSVAGSQFPAVAVVGAYLLYRTRVRWWQTLGLVASALSVSLIALS